MRARYWLIALLAACGDRGPLHKAELVPCFACASDFTPIGPTHEFPASGRWLGATFALATEDRGEKLAHVWTAVDVGEAAPRDREIARAELVLGGRRRGRIDYRQDVPLPPGRYRVALLLDDRPWLSADLRVVADPAQFELAARELLPLVEGVQWDYDATTTDGKGVTTAPQRVRIEVAGPAHGGQHLRLLREGSLVHEEWWALAPTGLLATHRRGAAGEVHLQPPQTLLPFPPGPLQRWEYVSADQTIRQSACSFGPRPVQGPEGPAPGYVVVVTDRSSTGEVSAERHFLPGFGLVHETIVHSSGGVRQLVQRLEIVRQPK
jgi:hypothetical protein